ncbi:MAG: hypothetical protein NXY57DRAFT_1044928 [Lentinula lateritia]|nr:MAG: hypothetical protein NXY57DRAFT_1044928 [Lentinula lateritia]
MGPNRTPKTVCRRVSAPRSLPRRHNMLLRSMTCSTDVQIPATATSTTSLSAYMNSRSSVNEPSISPSSPSPGSLSDDLPMPASLGSFSDDLPASGSAPFICTNSSFNKTSISPSTSSLGPLSDNILVSDELQSIDAARSSTLDTMFNETFKRTRDDQEKSIDFATKYIEILIQQCSDNKEIIHLKNVMRKLDYSCPLCKDLAWNPQVCVTNERRKGVNSGKLCKCLQCGFPIFRKPNPSVTIQQVVERIAMKLKIVEPPRHELDWMV